MDGDILKDLGIRYQQRIEELGQRFKAADRSRFYSFARPLAAGLITAGTEIAQHPESWRELEGTFNLSIHTLRDYLKRVRDDPEFRDEEMRELLREAGHAFKRLEPVAL